MTSPDSPSKKLLTLSSGGWVILLSLFLCLIAAALVLYPVYETGFHPAIGDGKNIDTYGFDLSNLTIPRAELSASGNAKDQIRAIPEKLVETATPDEIALMAQNESIRFLVPGDRVIGLVINGEARAYPTRVLTLHEIVNDRLGGVPIAVTWTPLCGAAVVFDRQIDGPAAPPAEFGNSGLMRSSNSIFFDRRSDPKQESLWPQLALHAISGPAAGKALTLIPFEFTSWKDWTRDHPSTRVLLGLRTHKTEYGSEPYSTYVSTDDLKFPVDPIWSSPKVKKKTPIAVTSADGVAWTAAFTPTDNPATTSAATAASSPAPPPYRIYSYLFAWYAQHSKDTDYSDILR